MKKLNTPSKKIAYTGILAALAIGLNLLESLLPAISFLPPGAKLGISNIVIMFSATYFGIFEAIAIAVIKSAFVGITRGAIAFCMSIAGGILSAFVTSLIMKSKKNPFGYIGIGIIGAVCHNAGQLLVALAVMGSTAVLYYAPYLLIFALITGAITGIILRVILPAIQKMEKYI